MHAAAKRGPAFREAAMKLEYASPPPPRAIPGWVTRMALASSLAAVPLLGVSYAMYVWLRPALRPVQLALIWTSMGLGAVGLVAAVLAWVGNRGGRREIIAVAVALAYAAVLGVAIKYG